MSELHSLIRRTIIDRGLTSVAERQDVYEQARTAVIRELWSYDPPLAEDEIDARIGQFDLAIGELEDDLADTFAEAVEAPPAPPQSTAKRTATVFEGYDHDVDYVPAYVTTGRQPTRGRPPPGQGRGPPDGMRAPGGTDGGNALDPLALRSAAIEEALRSGDDRFVSDEGEDAQLPSEAEITGFDDGYPAAEADDDRQPSTWSWDQDRSESTDYESEADDAESGLGAEEFAADERGEEESPRATKRPWTAVLAGLDERARIRLLVGAIAALAVVLVVLAGFMLSSLFSKSDDGPEAAAPAAVPGAGGGTPAAAPVAPPTDALQTLAVFDGSDPTVFDSGSGNPVRFDKSGGFARITSSTSDPGVRVIVGPGLATRVSGRSVRVTLIARASRENGASGLRFAYENGLAISPWQTANLGNDFQTYNLVWRVPSMRADPNADQLLIEPGIPGDGTAADIRSIRIDVLAR
jgi:hypothetical protein